MGGNVKELSGANFQSEVLQSDVPVLVDFWAPWCGPCRMLTPVIEEISNDYAGKLKVTKVNVDENASLAGSYGVMSIPTLMIFKDGQLVERFSGYMPKVELARKIDAVL